MRHPDLPARTGYSLWQGTTDSPVDPAGTGLDAGPVAATPLLSLDAPALVAEPVLTPYAVSDDGAPTQGTLAGFESGDTVVAISTDGQNFVPVDGSDDSFQNATTIDGTYLAYAVNADGTMRINAFPGDQQVVDAIQNNDTNDAPLTDSLYYRIADASGTVTNYEITYGLNDVIVATSGAPYTAPETVTPDSTVSIAGITVDKALADGQSSDQDETLSVTVSLLDRTDGHADGALSIDPDMAGAAGGSGETVSYGPNGGSVTIDGTIAQINADLQGLTYQSPNAGEDTIQLQATDGPSTTATYTLGTLATVPPPSQQFTYGYAVFPNLYGSSGTFTGFQTGDTVIAVSIDGTDYTPVVGSDDSFTNSTTIDGTYLDYHVNADGTSLASVTPDAQTLINDINANQGASTPLTDTMYYVIEDPSGAVTTYENTAQLDDVLINTVGAPYRSPETVAPFSVTDIPGLSVGKALSTGQDSDADAPLVATVRLFDFGTQKADGMLAIDPTRVGAGAGGTVTVTDDRSAITISGTVAQINADLQGLSYQAPAASDDTIDIQVVDGPATTPDYIVGEIDTCYCAGTRILTPMGEVRIEDLRVGDRVATINGGRPRVRWIGSRHVRVAERRDRRAAMPVRIRAGAFADGVPHSDLLLTQEHCVYQHGALVPIRMLVNNRSILLDETIEDYTYYHVELDRHGILFAEGLTAESYLDTGNRRLFDAAAGDPVPAFDGAHASWNEAAAPLRVDRAWVEPIWRRLDRRADAAGLPAAAGLALTDQPGLHLRDASGATLSPLRVARNRHAFEVPADSGGLTLCSRRFVPAETVGPFLDDRRELGVKVGEIVLRRGAHAHRLDRHLRDPGLAGWSRPEADGRWTTGAAELELGPMPPDRGAMLLEIEIVGGGPWRAAS